MNYLELSNVLKTMADPSRLEIIDLLSCGELCACDLLEYFPFSQPTLSHHMKNLIQNQLVTFHKKGTKKMYKLNQELIIDLSEQLALLGSNCIPCVCDSIKNSERNL